MNPDFLSGYIVDEQKNYIPCLPSQLVGSREESRVYIERQTVVMLP